MRATGIVLDRITRFTRLTGYLVNHENPVILSQTTSGQPSSSQQSRIVTTLRPRDLHLLRGGTKRTLCDLPVHLLGKEVPTIHRPTSDHNDLRIDQIDQVREPDPQIHAKMLEHRERELVTSAPSVVNLLRRQLLTNQSRLRKR